MRCSAEFKKSKPLARMRADAPLASSSASMSNSATCPPTRPSSYSPEPPRASVCTSTRIAGSCRRSGRTERTRSCDETDSAMNSLSSACPSAAGSVARSACASTAACARSSLVETSTCRRRTRSSSLMRAYASSARCKPSVSYLDVARIRSSSADLRAACSSSSESAFDWAILCAAATSLAASSSRSRRAVRSSWPIRSVDMRISRA
mmetsp:Transcript_13400/g.34152  ORF Transcript_13400/g.34152 Transcript_13400/m.34152 type:complete len:207 (+) Transcript_13400:697-1317(+)